MKHVTLCHLVLTMTVADNRRGLFVPVVELDSEQYTPSCVDILVILPSPPLSGLFFLFSGIISLHCFSPISS